MPAARADAGFTLVELIMVVAVIAIVASIAIPSLLRGRIAANESAAIGALRAINNAEASYFATAGGGGYAESLVTLGVPCPGNDQAFLSPDLMDDPALKSGYQIRLQAAAGAEPADEDCNGTATVSGFFVTAIPLQFARSGSRAFATNSASSIYFDPSGVAPTEAVIAGGGAKVIQ
jgi:prepilin-type N-terminal cleavage/methylation domain-containing protein